MKKSILFIILFSISYTIFSQTSSNYILVINGDSIPIDLNKDYTHKLKGKNVSIKLIQPATLSFNDDMISFKYPNDLSVSKTNIENGVDQIMLMTAAGNGYMIQTYTGFNPESLAELMMNEITKESVSYGYSKKQENIEYELTNGQVLKGLKATLEYKDEVEIYTVTAFGGKDEGIMVMTMVLSSEYNDAKIIDLLLETLDINIDKN